MTLTPFRKMNGLGNDFAVFDARRAELPFDRALVRAISDREHGIGCDQLIRMEPSDEADVFMRIWNCAGDEVEACGNATRCIGHLMLSETGKDEVSVRTGAGTLLCRRGAREGDISVDMGVPRFGWQEIPLAEEFSDTRKIELQVGPITAPILHSPSVVNVGNPHCIFWVEDIEAYDLARLGPMLENHPMFPERANISLGQLTERNQIRLKVWERSAGLTRACGTAACAAAVAAMRLHMTERQVTIHLPGGPLDIAWRERDGHILMTGPYQLDYEGEIDLAELAAAERAAQ